MNWFKGIVIFFGVILLMTAITWMSTGLNLAHYKFWGPKYEEARRNVFEETKSFQQGTIQELSKMYQEYNDPAKSQSQKDAIAFTALHQVADFKTENLPPYLAKWIESLRNPTPTTKF